MKTKKDKMEEGDICPDCNEGIIIFIPEDFPWTIDHYQCSLCDSTFFIEKLKLKKF